MKKISILIITISMALMLALSTNAYSYTISHQSYTYYNQTTSSIGSDDLFDIGGTTYERMYYNLGTNISAANIPIRLVFSSSITTSPLQPITLTYKLSKITISFYTSDNILLLSEYTYFDIKNSMSYFENNFLGINTSLIDYIVIKWENLPIDYDEDLMHVISHGAIIVTGDGMTINDTISSSQYQSGWGDAMNSKVTQIWSLWGNIFDTFMSVFNVFSVKLMGDITIGHLALVPLVLGLIGFIYALGGKRGR